MTYFCRVLLFFSGLLACDQMPTRISRSFEFNEDQVESYHNKPSNDLLEVKRVIESGFFVNSKEILDVGCGDGRLTALFAANLPNTSILGCDISKTMIEYALKLHASSNLNFVERSAENLEFENKFDTVISFNCLHWIENQKRVLDQIYLALKPGGKALLVATPASANNDFKTICRSVIMSLRWLPYFFTFRSVHSFHTEQEYGDLLNKAGFLIERVEVKPTELVFKDRNSLELFLRAILTPLQHLVSRHQPAFLEDFFRELERRGRVDAQGFIHIHFDQIELVIIKST